MEDKVGFEDSGVDYTYSGNGELLLGGPLKRPKIREEGHDDDEEGELIRREFEHHEKGVARINNGSFGCCPSSVLSAQAKWQRLFIQQPDSFFFGSLQNGILRSRQIISSLINAAHVEEVSLVDNVTTAVAVVLQQVAWAFIEGNFKKGEDAILMLSYSYGAVKKAIDAYARRAGAVVVKVHLPFPVSSKEEIIETFRETLMRNKAQSKRIRVAVLDHVISMPSVVLPVKELIKICREEGVDQVFVDGAHAIGNLDIDMQDIGADCYASNLHKWFFCPPSVAFLYCRQPLLQHLHHPVVSSEYDSGLALESAWVGNRDYSAQLSVPAALQFIEKFEGGIEGIRSKNHDCVIHMAEMLAKAWDTHLGAPPDLCSSMAMVGLPESLKVGSEKDAMYLRTLLRKKFGVEVPIYYRPATLPTDHDPTERPATLPTDHDPTERPATLPTDHDPTERPKTTFSAYARISHQMYNTTDDYLKFCDAVKQLVSEASQSQ